MCLRNVHSVASKFITVLVRHAPHLLEVILKVLQRLLTNPEMEYPSLLSSSPEAVVGRRFYIAFELTGFQKVLGCRQTPPGGCPG